jgi:hypothetical protein
MWKLWLYNNTNTNTNTLHSLLDFGVTVLYCTVMFSCELNLESRGEDLLHVRVTTRAEYRKCLSVCLS